MLLLIQIKNNTVLLRVPVYRQLNPLALILKRMATFLKMHHLDLSTSAEGATGGVFRIVDRLLDFYIKLNYL